MVCVLSQVAEPGASRQAVSELPSAARTTVVPAALIPCTTLPATMALSQHIAPPWWPATDTPSKAQPEPATAAWSKPRLNNPVPMFIRHR